jgi:hypothetical protein
MSWHDSRYRVKSYVLVVLRVLLAPCILAPFRVLIVLYVMLSVYF